MIVPGVEFLPPLSGVPGVCLGGGGGGGGRRFSMKLIAALFTIKFSPREPKCLKEVMVVNWDG